MLFDSEYDSTPALIINLVFGFLTLAIIARALLSWFNMDPRSPIVATLNQITEPILDPIRRIMPRIGMFDLSPIVAILLLTFVSQTLQAWVSGEL